MGERPTARPFVGEGGGAVVRVESYTGRQALETSTELLRRARLSDPVAGIWDAADVQWWWRRARTSDDAPSTFWCDAHGPVAGVLLTSQDQRWQVDPLLVPHAVAPSYDEVLDRAVELGREYAGSAGFEVPVGGQDAALEELVRGRGLVAGERSWKGWLEAPARTAAATLPEGFVLADRTERADAPHPMTARSGEAVADRLGECSLYDPALDLAVLDRDGRVAAYSLYWYDPVTRAGLVEPVRVEDAYQRRGLGRCMIAAGLARLTERGARRVKIGWASEAAGALYQGLGFRPVSQDTWWVWSE